MIYLDNAASTPTDKRVVGTMLPYFSDVYGNPSAVHPMGRQAREAIDTARGQVARFINAEDDEIIFTGSGTEANNLAIMGVANAYGNKGKHIITSQIEHPAVLEVCHELGKRDFEITYLPVDSCGMVSAEAVRQAITGQTILISVMAANNVIGTIQPIREIGAIARERGVLFHTDAVQIVGHLPVDVKRDNVDLLSLSAHKFGGPKGVGALYGGLNVSLLPVIYGGGQEGGLRSGTENVPGIVGLGKASELARGELKAETRRIRYLRNALIRGVLQAIPGSKLNGHTSQRLPNNVNISIADVEGEYLTKELGNRGLCVSTGSACSSAINEAPYVLLAMGVERDLANCSVRLSIGRDNTEAEINDAVDIIAEVTHRIRNSSQ
jgi:cysteine desulfurase